MSYITPERAGDIRGELVEQHGATWLHHYAAVIEAEVSAHYESQLRAAAELSYEKAEALGRIADLAHAKSTGPAVPDTLWEIRNIAQEAL